MQAPRTRSGQRPVVVGVDGSAASEAAASLGSWEAARRNAPLLLVHGYQVPSSPPGQPSTVHQLQVDLARQEAQTTLSRAERRVHAGSPTLHIHSVPVTGSPAGALVELSAQACLVVVGCRGAGGFTGLTLGSVAAQVARYAHAPVVVVRPPVAGAVADVRCVPTCTPGPVVVGLDVSGRGTAALSFAFEEAQARGTSLTAVYGVPRTRPPRPHDRGHGAARELRAAGRVVKSALAGWPEKYPDVEVRTVLAHTEPAMALHTSSLDAGLVVVGDRGRDGFPDLRLGSVSAILVEFARCPVAIVPTAVPPLPGPRPDGTV
jgi:nucleotide-binding universal stress UspA family protein